LGPINLFQGGGEKKSRRPSSDSTDHVNPEHLYQKKEKERLFRRPAEENSTQRLSADKPDPRRGEEKQQVEAPKLGLPRTVV